MRQVVVLWLLVLHPVALAFLLDRALPRLSTFGATGWLIVGARVVLAGAGIAVARRLRTRDPGAWHGVAIWALAAIAATLLDRAWPVLPTSLAPSEVRIAAALAVARDAALAVVAAWLARTGTAAPATAARARDSS